MLLSPSPPPPHSPPGAAAGGPPAGRLPHSPRRDRGACARARAWVPRWVRRRGRVRNLAGPMVVVPKLGRVRTRPAIRPQEEAVAHQQPGRRPGAIHFGCASTGADRIAVDRGRCNCQVLVYSILPQLLEALPGDRPKLGLLCHLHGGQLPVLPAPPQLDAALSAQWPLGSVARSTMPPT